MTSPDLRTALNAAFAYKAEWLKEQIFDLFTAPSYFPELLTHYPCVLIGGRGTGKTTVLRGLSYQGQYALLTSNRQVAHLSTSNRQVSEWDTYNFYYRVDTNRVTAFEGPELSEERWDKLFAHYVNLLLVDLSLEFLDWYEAETASRVVVDPQACRRLSTSLLIERVDTHSALRHAVLDSIVDFESHVNNIADNPPVRLSMQGAPLTLLFRSLGATDAFRGKRFSFLIDEYENLTYRQQRVVNTLIKHASDSFVFKIGVKELGWRCRSTLNPDEQLVSPADYRLINIPAELDGAAFSDFASRVCEARLRTVADSCSASVSGITDLLTDISLDDEAQLLGVSQAAASIRQTLHNVPDCAKYLDALSDFEIFFAGYWATGQKHSLAEVVREAVDNPTAWRGRLVNHGHAALFTLKRGKTGIRKYYCGWECFIHLASTNIRYLLELVDTSLASHLNNGGKLSEPVDAHLQTLSAQEVGKKNLGELEGLSTHGAKLTKLLLGLGRVFGVMAGDPVGHTPEVNEFELADSEVDAEVQEILHAAVMHLALVRFSGTKPVSNEDTRDYDYSIHPIFAPFFVFSHRRKRKCRLSGRDILRLVNSPRSGVEAILNRTGRSLDNSNPEQLLLFKRSDDPLPEQLLMFEKYYDGN